MDICGIYKITNKINLKSYIGESVRINARWLEHKRKAFNKEVYPKEYEKALYKAFRKYGLENFDFEIIEQCDKDLLLEKEIYYIKKYNTFEKGYNETSGGDAGGINNKGSNHANAKLTDDDIKDIRYRYSLMEETMIEVYEDYKERIGISGFKKIFYGYSWSHIMMEVYNEETKNWHYSKSQSRPGSKNGRAILNEEEVKSIRKRFKNGETRSQIYKDYKDRCSIKVIYNILRENNREWNNI